MKFQCYDGYDFSSVVGPKVLCIVDEADQYFQREMCSFNANGGLRALK